MANGIVVSGASFAAVQGCDRAYTDAVYCFGTSAEESRRGVTEYCKRFGESCNTPPAVDVYFCVQVLNQVHSHGFQPFSDISGDYCK